MAGNIGVGQFVTDVCKCPIEPKQKARHSNRHQTGAGVLLSWSGARCRHRKQIKKKTNFLAPFRDSFASCENIETVVIFFPQKEKKKRNCVCVYSRLVLVGIN